VHTLLRRVGLTSLALLLIAACSIPAAQSRSRSSGATNATGATNQPLTLSEFTLSQQKLDVLRDHFFDQVETKYPAGSWAPLRMELSDQDLAIMGLPDRATLQAHRYSTPTTFTTTASSAKTSSAKGQKPQPQPQPAASSAVTTFAGTGYFGIRPGAWILLINDEGIGWCSAAHVFGSPGSYEISTAGHCGKTGDVVTMIGAVGDNNPVLIDIGQFSRSTGDAGLGKDYAFISVYPQYQNLVTPTMCFWGGPRGVYTTQGDLARVDFAGNSLTPTPTVDPNPALAQQIVHYGHGTGVGAGGTPRSAAAISWRSTTFMFFGAISPGDSGSGSNTLTGDVAGDTMEAAGINTHLYVDPLMRQGLGIMGGTRTSAIGVPANGQLVSYPVPAPGLP
jgi:hypothetical protein